MMTESKETAYWAIRAVSKAIVSEMLSRGAITSGEALDALVDGLDAARENYWEERRRFELGH
jgi:hypothetical protein